MDSKLPKQDLVSSTNRRKPKGGRFIRGFLAFILVVTIGMAGLVTVVSISPAIGAVGADWLRNLLGPKPVANLEALVFTIQDTINQVVHKIDQATPSAPWEISVDQRNSPSDTRNDEINLSPTLRDAGSPNIPGTASVTEINSQLLSQSNPTESPQNVGDSASGSIPGDTPIAISLSPASTQSSNQEPWKPEDIPPLGNTPDEGTWIPYIQDETGVTLAYRTFLQPDPQRPYSVIGIVAFDLSRVELHYQLGTLEPKAPGFAPGTGEIPSADKLPGILLAAFNGGFKTINGHFGVYMNGEEILPPISNMATIAIYKDGSIRIGEWNSDFPDTTEIVAYRQNCPLMVHDGEINPLVFNNSFNDWGGTITGNVVTFRSGIGISQDGKTLFYFAGNGLNMPALATAMQEARAYQAMQLDINSYYVLFTKFVLNDGQWTAEPLLPKEMVDNIDRFLVQYSHDFFYVTLKNP